MTEKPKKKLISLDAYLRSLKVRPHHVAPMRTWAKGLKIATKEQWDEIYKNY
jgi:hypothetical protein